MSMKSSIRITASQAISETEKNKKRLTQKMIKDIYRDIKKNVHNGNSSLIVNAYFINKDVINQLKKDGYTIEKFGYCSIAIRWENAKEIKNEKELL